MESYLAIGLALHGFTLFVEGIMQQCLIVRGVKLSEFVLYKQLYYYTVYLCFCNALALSSL